MHIADVDLSALAPGTRTHLQLDVSTMPDGSRLSLSLLVVVGTQSGPTLVVLAGVHGDEYEGIRAIQQVYRALKPEDVRGRWLAVPVANPPAYAAATRSSPVDGLNLARIFPGDPQGSLSQRIAHVLTQTFIVHADLLVDLHSAGIAYTMPTLCGYYLHESDMGRASRRAALAFGAPVVWGHPDIAPGRSVSAATDLGVPWIYTEAAGGGRVQPEDLSCYVRGVFNVMKHLGMLAGSPEAPVPRYDLAGEGNLEKAITANTSGLFVPTVSLLDEVHEGQVLGHIMDMAGEPLEELRASTDGLIILMRGLPMIRTGDWTFMITQRYRDNRRSA